MKNKNPIVGKLKTQEKSLSNDKRMAMRLIEERTLRGISNSFQEPIKK